MIVNILDHVSGPGSGKVAVVVSLITFCTFVDLARIIRDSSIQPVSSNKFDANLIFDASALANHDDGVDFVLGCEITNLIDAIVCNNWDLFKDNSAVAELKFLEPFHCLP